MLIHAHCVHAFRIKRTHYRGLHVYMQPYNITCTCIEVNLPLVRVDLEIQGFQGDQMHQVNRDYQPLRALLGDHAYLGRRDLQGNHQIPKAQNVHVFTMLY